MEVFSLDIPELKIVRPAIFQDARGFFSETYNRQALAAAGISADFVQDNHSLSVDVGVVRGLHFQSPPAAQDKLVRVVRGKILDVTVDIRRGSPTFGRHVAVTLSSTNRDQIWVPKGFAHGFCTLEPNTEVFYKVTEYFAPQCDRGIAWDDPALAIDWGIDPMGAVLSPKDRSHPKLADLPHYFEYPA
jgi:dTDP-4-dehydrorhamnose 3,5-epimerase